MKQTVNEHDFIDAFRQCGRKDQFSYTGLKALFEYLEQLEQDLGEEIELDPIALCCEYTEYSDLEAFQADYGEDDYPDMQAIEDNTTVIDIDGTAFIIADF